MNKVGAGEIGGWALARRAIRPTIFALGLVAGAFALRLLPSARQDFGVWAGHLDIWQFCLIATLACASGVPRQAIAFAAGYADGFVMGSLLALICETASCLMNVIWARYSAQRWVLSHLPARWLAGLDRTIIAQPFVSTLGLRLLPVGSNLLLNLAAGALDVPVVPFVLASALGFVPQTIIFALLGSGVHVDRWMELAGGAALFALSTLLAAIVFRRQRSMQA